MIIFLSLRVTADAEGGLKIRAQLRPDLQGFGGGQPPTSEPRYIPRHCLPLLPHHPLLPFPCTYKPKENHSIAMASSNLSIMSFTSRNLLGGRRDSLESSP